MHNMSRLLKTSLALLAAVTLLLLTGGFPPAGIPAVYHSEVMLLCGVGVCIICLWAAWRLAIGQRVRFIIGLGFAFFVCVGLIGAWQHGAKALQLASLGGAMWFGVVGMACLAIIGVLFGVIFGFFTLRLMQPKLWLAALHLSVALVIIGAWADLLGSESTMLRAAVGGEAAALPGDAGFSLHVTDFKIDRYDTDESYTLLHHEGGQWRPIGTPSREGDTLTLGSETWSLSALQRVPGVAQPAYIIPGTPPRLLLASEAPVRSYSATCRFTPTQPGAPAQEHILRVNEPAAFAEHIFYLMSYTPRSYGGTEVMIQMRRAPGRRIALIGLLACIVCSAFWTFAPAPKEPIQK